MMMNLRILFLLVLFPAFPALSDHSGKGWDFVKERHQIKLYTRDEDNSSLKSFRGVMEIKADMEVVSSMIGNPKDLEWWGEYVHQVRVLKFEKDMHIQYYLVYDSPWPFTDRDLVADVKILTDSGSGTRTVYSTPLLNVVPEKPDLIRVTKYWQKWTLQPLPKGRILIILEGFIDPAGNIPAWLYNMIVIDTPLKLMREVQKRAQK